jgi:anti-sigma B factor antagonist
MTVLTVGGELELGQAEARLAPLRAAVANGDDPVVLDLTDVTFIDSNGLRVLLEANAALERLVVVCPPGSAVATLLGLTSLDSVLTIRPDVDTARAAAGEDRAGS